jgi:hypothetical protein
MDSAPDYYELNNLPLDESGKPLPANPPSCPARLYCRAYALTSDRRDMARPSLYWATLSICWGVERGKAIRHAEGLLNSNAPTTRPGKSSTPASRRYGVQGARATSAMWRPKSVVASDCFGLNDGRATTYAFDAHVKRYGAPNARGGREHGDDWAASFVVDCARRNCCTSNTPPRAARGVSAALGDRSPRQAR